MDSALVPYGKIFTSEKKSLDEMGSLISSFSKKPGGLEGFWSLIPNLSILPFARRAGIRGGVHCPRLLKRSPICSPCALLFPCTFPRTSHTLQKQHPGQQALNPSRKSTGQVSMAPCTGCSHLGLSKPASRQPYPECNIPAGMPR